jgi:hypothetical protein
MCRSLVSELVLLELPIILLDDKVLFRDRVYPKIAILWSKND